jgi:hypothetical protein
MEPRPRKLLDQVRDVIRMKHYSYRTEESDVAWIRRFGLSSSTTNAILARWKQRNRAVSHLPDSAGTHCCFDLESGTQYLAISLP